MWSELLSIEPKDMRERLYYAEKRYKKRMMKDGDKNKIR